MAENKKQAWRYHAEYKPKVFEGEAIELAERAGWVDSPAKVEAVDAGDTNPDAGNGGGQSSSRELTEEEVALGFQLPENLQDLSVKKLKKLCKARGKTGYSNLNEADLLALLEG